MKNKINIIPFTGCCLISACGIFSACQTKPEKSSSHGANLRPQIVRIHNAQGMSARFCSNGARLMSLTVPDKNGRPVGVVIGFDDPKDYDKATEPYFGATIGRYGNRIAKGKFNLDGKSYQLTINNGPNTLHGGSSGFQYKNWLLTKTSDSTVVCRLTSEDGDNGFPGTLKTVVTYRLGPGYTLDIDYQASTDRSTVANLTNHAFFNLNGEGSGTINGHVLKINADKYTPVDSTLIPTGQLERVKGTPFDFTAPVAIGGRVNQNNTQLRYGKGYDHNFVLNDPGLNAPAAEVRGEKTGIIMRIYTTEPGLQFYGGNFMQSKNKLRKGTDDFRTAFCLETQHFPDAPNHLNFPDTELKPGRIYQSHTAYAFSVAK